ncbi:MAG: tyrosine-type recombinase/integrase [Porphyromonas sp.]|nr:tyrosine-type recombinase/integrase [Porphyromonas sp.]
MELLDQYLGYLAHEQNRSEHTVQAYRDDVYSYLEHCREQVGEDYSPSSGDLDLLRRWLGDMMSSGHKASSVARRLAAVKGFYKYLLRIGVLDRNPIANLKAPRGEKPLPVYVPTVEIERILEELPREDEYSYQLQYLVIATLYECGLRRSELAGLRDRDVDLRQRQLKVLGKGDKERIIPFGTGLAERMAEWRRLRDERFGSSEVFFLSLSGKPMNGAEVYEIVHRLLATVPNLARRGAHALRHSFATDMLNGGADLVAIKELMGHSQVSTTVKYTHTSFRQLQQMYNAHPRAKKKS